MGQHVAKLTPALLFVGGCSLIYNPNNIDKPPVDASDAPMHDADTTIDANIDAPPLFDANPGMLTLLDLAPTTIYEGQGIDNSAPAMLIIKGHHIVPGATVTIAPTTNLTVGTPQIAMNGDYLAVPVTVAVDNAVNTGTVALTVTVTQPNGPGPQAIANKLSLAYLPQLTGATLTLPLAERYSRAAFNAAPTIAGTSGRVMIRSMSSITCGTGTGALNARGANATGMTGGSAGPGACGGAAAGAAGGCAGLIGGGGAAGGSGGGGGGGFGTSGFVGGGGASGGALGPMHGTATVLSYDGVAADGGDRNQASGGGGGATALGATSNAGAGGGGGGTIELTAGGDIKCGTIDVGGGNGAAAAAILGAAGGGGGGAGGLVVLRNDAGTITVTNIVAAGGSPGAGVQGGAAGGNGGFGRVRVDTAGTPPSSSPAVRRGLAFASSTMRISTTINPAITMLGTDGDVFDLYVVDDAGAAHFGEPQNQAIDGTGMKTFMPTLLPGYNRLCATLRPGVRALTDPFSLADKCIEIAFLP